VCKQKINDETKCREIAGNFDHHADALVHCLMEHIQGFTRSHWMQPSGVCLHPIAPASAKFIDFGFQHKTKHNF
jgi:hypothetical protein